MPQGTPDGSMDEFKRGKNHLFAIGINTYENFSKLPNARKDVEDLAKVLVENYYFDPSHIRTLCDADATKENIIDELDGMRSKVKADDRLLLYYSGHGFMDGSRGFWIPVDAKPQRVASYIANAEVRDIIQCIDARHILLISDSCFSGSLLLRDASRDINGAVADWERNPSRHIFISGKGVVSDGKAGENSPFAASILKHLRQNEAEALNCISLADQVTEEVRWNYEQQAEISALSQAGHQGGRFIFFKRQTEKDDWQTALRIHTEGAFMAYLTKNPTGQFAKDADQKLVEIADEREWQRATSVDAAFAYLQYQRRYPQGKYVAEARAKLGLIEQSEETETRERERLARVEAEKKEIARLAQIETDKKERERLAQIEAEKKKLEQIKQIKTEEKERKRLEKALPLEKATEDLAQTLPPKDKEPTTIPPSGFQKYKIPAISGGVLLLALLVWQLAKPSQETHSYTQPEVNNLKPETTFVQTKTNPNLRRLNANDFKLQNPKGEEGVVSSKERRPVTLGDIVKDEKTKPIRLGDPAYPELDSKLPHEPKAAARKYLQMALNNIEAGDYSAARNALTKANELNLLSVSVKNSISMALTYMDAYNYAYAKTAIENAKKALY